MTNAYRVLWIEDAALEELRHLAAVVYADLQFDLQIATDASEAFERLRRAEFDAVVVDVRIPPGTGTFWSELFGKAGNTKESAQLGIEVIRTALQEPEHRHEFAWLTADRIGILSVEEPENVREAIADLGVRVVRQKNAQLPESGLLDMVREILGQG